MSHILARGAVRTFGAHVAVKVDPIAFETFVTVHPIKVPAKTAILGTRCASSRDCYVIGIKALVAITWADGRTMFAQVVSARFAAFSPVIYIALGADITLVASIANCAVFRAILTDGVAGC